MPRPIKVVARTILMLWNKLLFLIKFRFLPPPDWTDLVGYEKLITFIHEHDVLQYEGDLIEIGAFCGGGTYKLSKYLSKQKSKKKIYAIDIFDISADTTKNTKDVVMSQLYADVLKGHDQWQVFCQVTKGCENVEVIRGDSKAVVLPTSAVCCAFIDGNHDSTYVENDFYLVWKKLSPGGWVAFHDYGHDLPQITKTINELINTHASEVANTLYDEKKWIIYIQKSIDS